ncbi:MAG TPA: TlpA disulfide reductase family protein [Pyrinomonadaceae bacterium]
MKKSLLLIAISFLLCHAALAQQNKSKPESLSEKVINAEFQSLDESPSIKLSDYRGKVIVLVLWASWCGPCRLAVTGLNDFNKDFTYRGVEVLGLSLENPTTDAENVHAFIRDSKPDYRLGWVNEDIAREFLGDKTVVPQILVCTDEGLILKRFLGYNPNKTIKELREIVEQALINPPARQ